MRLASGSKTPSKEAVFFTGPGHETLLVRSKNFRSSGNLPLGNGVAAESLHRLGKLTGEERYTRSAARTTDALSGVMAQAPSAAESPLEAQMMLAEEEASVATAAAEDRQPPLTVRASATPDEVRPGQKFRVAIEGEVDAGWHWYGENPEVEFLRPTRVSVSAPDGFEVGKTDLPEAIVRPDRVFDKPLRLYEGTVTFRIPVTAGSDAASGKATLRIELEAQSCDDTRCLDLRTHSVEIPVTITAGDA